MRFLGAMRAGALAVVLSVLPAAAHAESLKAALESAYQNNPNIMSALLNVKATAENIALAKPDPTDEEKRLVAEVPR